MILCQKINQLALTGASAKELGNVISTDREFSTHVVRLAGCKENRTANNDTITRSIVLLGMERVCELA